ncbi:polyketide synthase dehydratase-domain-containing protein [Aspergillus navahoensis]
MGAAASMLANRVSWFFNLKGTSLNLDSACSSSLVALHLACRDLQLGTASMALVGGANLVYHPNFMKMMSAFDFSRLSDALHDGDTIRAVIRSTGSNQDGRTPGITQPNDPLYIGAVKANIGHLEGASGLAGFVKAILVLENALIPPIAGLDELNSRIDADKLGLQFPKQPIPWPTAGLRRACVNSFGFGGTNATVILDGAYHYLELNSLQGCHRTRRLPPPCYEPSSLSNGSAPQTPTLFVWSGADKQAAQTLTIAYHDFIRRGRSDLPSIAYSMVQRRTPLQWRAFLVAHTNQDSLLHAPQSPRPTRVQDNPRLAYIFTGQGAQCLGMGRELFSFAAFRESIELCDQCLQQLECSWSVQQVLEGYADEISVEDPEFGQPLTTCLQIALTDLLKSLGIVPIAAAYAVGGLSRFSAVVVAQASGLSMMAVGLSRLYGSTRVSIGCVNSPQNITLTGAVDQLDVLQEWFARDLITARRLRIPLAYHSEAMAAVLETGAKDDSICMISSVTSDIVQPRALSSPEYWINNLISVVDFEGALAKLIAHSNKQPRKRLGGDAPSDLRTSHLLEIGPHSALQGPVREALQASSKARKPAYIPLLIRGRNSCACLMEAAGWLYCAGFPVDILAVNGIYRRTPPPMPCGMPQYPFTHTRSHWAEGRLSENFRMKSKARHDLVGTRSVDWNPQLAQWRNILRLREVPWLQDHTIDGQIVVPAAGTVVMAVEALRELLGAEVQLAGIHLKNVGFLHPMRYTHDTEELETQLTLSADGQSRVGDSVWFHFRLFAIDGGSYTECCNGDIQGVVVPDSSPSYMLDGEPLQAWVSNATGACTQPSNAYSFLARGAVKYGPCFRGVESLRVSTSGEAICDVNMDTWRPHTSQEQPPEYLVHPCTLDALIQLVVPSLTGGQGALPTTVPARASRIWIDCSASLELKKGKIIALARSVRVNRGTTSDIVGMTRGTARPVLRIDNLETRFIDTVSADHTETGPRVLCTKLVWRPDISMMDEGQVLDAVTRDRPRAPEGAISQFQALTLAILCFIHEALFYLDTLQSLSVPVYLHAYVDWLRHQQQTLHPYVSATAVKDLLANSEAREHLIATTEISGMEGYFYMQVGRQLIPILTGAVDPLDLMFSDGLADRYYEEVLSTPHHAYPAMAYLQQLCFKNPALNILEVGAGTGGQTLRLLEAITSDGVPKCTRYDYTDISPAFFARAREKFRGYADIDPISQSFKPADYDLVKASHVLHATPKLDESLQNIRKLLKPGGKLLLVETTRPDCLYVGFALGLLKGWWEPLGHESRSRLSPCLETTQWDRVLKLNGFSGVDIDLPGQEHMEYRYSSIIISTAVASGTSTASNGQVLLVTNPDNNYQAEVAALIGKDLPSSVCTLEELAGITLSPSTSVVLLLELRAFVLDGMSAETYERLHSILIRAKNVLWVGQPITAEDLPQHHLAEGLGRSLASEDSTLKFVTLVLDHAEPDQRAAHLVLKVIKHMEASSIEAMEANWCSNSGILHIPRLSDSSEINGTVSLMLRPCRQEHCTLTTDTKPLQEDEVVVQVKAFGLTFHQLDLGLESGYLPGDRVCLIGMRLARSHVRAHVSNAASLPCSLWIAYYAIHYLARLQPDESVLIPQASSSAGQMLVQLATKRGAQVLAMASTDAKKAFISDSLHVPEDNVLVLSPGSSVDGFVHRLTDDKGIDAVIGPLSGHCELDLDLSSCLAPRKWHQLTLHANNIMKAKPTLTRQTLYDAMQVYREEQLCPPQPIKVFSAGDVEAAFREFQEADTFGKRVGARHLILLSRSGASTSAARDLVRELELQGVAVATPKVGISNLSSLGEVLAQLAETMPPVRGCIQATMVLRDNLFENMSYDDWVVSTSCKVAGLLHPHGVTNGIFGNRGQANYAAGNTFMDALARYRLARGQKAVSIDLGMMIDEGVVAANQSLLASLRRLGHLMELRQEELMALLDYYCNPDLPLLPPDNAQVIVGIQLPSEMIAKGFDLHHSIKRPIFSHLFQMAPRHLSASASAPLSSPHAIDRPATLKAAPTQEEATSLVTEWACAEVSHVLGLSVSDIDPAKPIHVYGIDSLVAVDLKNWFEREIGARLSVFDLMGNVPLQTLAELAAEASRFRC